MNSKYITIIDDYKRAVRDNGADGQTVLDMLAKNDLSLFESSGSIESSELSKESQPSPWGVMEDISMRDVFDLLTVIRDQNDKIISLLEKTTVKPSTENNNTSIVDINTNSTSDILVSLDNPSTVKQNKPNGGTTTLPPYWTTKRWFGATQATQATQDKVNTDTMTIKLEPMIPGNE